MSLRPCLGLSLLCVALSSTTGFAAAPPRLSNRNLIDRLILVSHSDHGERGIVNGDIFLPLDSGGGRRLDLFDLAAGSSSPMHTLVRRGAAAVPDLLAHLNDKRRTRFVIKHSHPSSYTVTVGDLCYVALGQIVNRRYAILGYPFGNASVYPVGSQPDQIANLVKEWGGLTAARHRASLLRDARKAIYVEARIEALKRLAWYHPDAQERLALKLLALPVRAAVDAQDFIEEKLLPATAKERQRLFRAFVARHGPDGREAVLRELFASLGFAEGLDSDEGCREVRPLLVELFGYKPNVRFEDRPDFLTAHDAHDKAQLIGEALIHDDSRKIDRVIRDLLVSTKDDRLAEACLERLVGRGYDDDIERYCKRRLSSGKKADQEAVQTALDRLGWTRLHVAVERGRADLVPGLLAAENRPDAPSRTGETPLHLAARLGNEYLLSLLLSRKSNLDDIDSDGLTAAQLAARCENDDLVLLLAAHGCSIPDILVAAIVGRADLVARFLHDKPAAIRERTFTGRTPLFLASRHGRTAVLRRLLDAGAAVNASRNDGTQPLHLAAHGGHAEVVQLLLARGAKVNREDGDHRTPLFHAVGQGHEGVARLLLKHKASPNAKTERGCAPLVAASSAGRKSLVKLLLDAGANPDQLDAETGQTALHRAARNGWTETVGLLLDRGAKRNVRDKEGKTPLSHAADENREDALRLLLRKEADPNIADDRGMAPLHIAASSGRSRLVKILLEYKADPENQGEQGLGTPLHCAARAGRLDTIGLLLKHGANLRARNSEGKTILHTAAFEGSVAAARLLLDKGAPVDARDEQGRTPLHWAVFIHTQDREAMARLLLDHKANVNARDDDGQTPLHWAIGDHPDLSEREKAILVPVIRLLVERKADATIKDDQGRTPLDIARTMKFTRAVELLSKGAAKK
jgi:ankyrin repeat protein